MPATILLIRHAAHIDLDQRLSGRTEARALSEAGRDQARRLAARLAAVPVDRVLTSPLERAVETAAAIAGAHGLAAPTEAAALTEIDFGDWTGRGFADLHADPAWAVWNRARATARPPGGESMAEAQARVAGWLHETRRSCDGQTVAAVSHSDVIKALVCAVIGLTLDNLLTFDIGPASVTRIVAGDWGARVMSVNEGLD